MAKLILASSSERRLWLLERIGIKPDLIIPADIDESQHKKEKNTDYVDRMSREKLAKVAKDNRGSIIIAADTIVISRGRILPKAETDEQVRYCLNSMSGRAHRVITSVSGISANQDRIITKKICTRVIFKKLSESEIEAYVLGKEGLGKAGGYAIQAYADSFVLSLNGSYSNIVGLPLYTTKNILTTLGY